MTRFQQRRKLLLARKVCTRCARERAKEGCHWCPTCLGVEAAKKELRTGDAARERRAARRARKRVLLLTVAEKLG